VTRSVLIRGNIYDDRRGTNFLDDVVKSIRSWHNGEIVVSTWKGQEKFVSAFSWKNCDKFLFLADPGSFNSILYRQMKRQVHSYWQGLQVCTGDQILVIRSDITVNQNPFANMTLYPECSDILRVFQNKIVIPNMMTIRPDSNESIRHFRVSDWMQIGNRDDILKWGNIEQQIFNLDEGRAEINGCCTETLWFLSVLKNKNPEIDIYDSKNIDLLSTQAILNNFIVLDMIDMLNSRNLNWTFQPQFLHCYFSHNYYRELYKKSVIPKHSGVGILNT